MYCFINYIILSKKLNGDVAIINKKHQNAVTKKKGIARIFNTIGDMYYSSHVHNENDCKCENHLYLGIWFQQI